ncbi:hypothetical protein HS088_TW17G00299 [Tripterygium wilfordii]|uniref:BTB domain-containing protein n=1 Tax=Tripterygium wilfordii TaxID=458696 RepID=A0A7J7CF52_TRIWF|nr:ARM REPEAT PROTEIN INTERACTING WITH ABF2-like [Tripterygium wilfordii]KAF5732769.1 hypothetical protein HS088_TW17G00299 [Tripterygium wilfordii]
MANQKNRATTAKRSLKRMLEREFEEYEDDRKVSKIESCDSPSGLMCEIRSQVEILNSTNSLAKPDCVASRKAANFLSQIAKTEDTVSLIVDCGAVPALTKHLQVLSSPKEGDDTPKLYKHAVEEECAAVLGLLAFKPEHQQLIVDAGALTHLVDLLNRHKIGCSYQAHSGVICRAADTITNLAYENSSIKSLVRIEGGIPALVELLEFGDDEVQRAAAGTLRTLAYRNDENKKKIIECNALPALVLMLQSDDASIHSEAVGVIGNLVHSSPDIKNEVLHAGALQPVIRLLSSSCSVSQKEAALLLGQFAAADSDCKVHIAQRGAVQPLIEMLHSQDLQVKEMSAFALGRLAQDSHNQAGIAQNGGIVPLLELLDSENESLQHNAAFALFGLADNEDNVADFIKFGGIQKLQRGEFIAQRTRICIAKTCERLEEKIHGRVLSHLLYLMRVADKAVKKLVALALAHFCRPDDRKNIFLDNNGLELLLELLESRLPKQKKDVSVALHKLAVKATSVTKEDATPLSSNPRVYLGEQYVNNPTLSDVTFVVEGRRFYAHRICLIASSEAFRAMFDGGYRERDVEDVEIPNIRWDVFELMMRFIYTGSVDINIDIAQDLLRAADQYLLDSLKSICEYAIAQDISVDNVSLTYEFSEAFNAMSLRRACILFILEHYDKLSMKPWYSRLIRRIIPEMRSFFAKEFTKPIQSSQS